MQNYEHDEYSERLFDYVSDVLADEERAAVERHIASCAKCKAELNEIKAIIQATEELDEPEIPSGLRDAISDRIANEEKIRRANRKSFGRAIQFVVPIAACAALAIGVYSGGVYDKYMKADDVISTGESISQNETVYNAEAEESAKADAAQTRELNAETEAAPKSKEVKNNKKAQNTTKSEPLQKSVEEKTEETLNESDTASRESGEDAALPMTLSEDTAVNSDIVESAADVPSVAAEKAVGTAESMTDSGAAATRAAEGAKVKSKNTAEAPTTCTVITDEPNEFATGFKKELTDEKFIVSQDEWKAFVEYVRNYGARLDADFSGEYTGETIVIVKNKNKG